jgi:hypothetical protein
VIARRLALLAAALALLAATGVAAAAPGHTPPVGGPPPFPVDEIIAGLRTPQPPGLVLFKRAGPEILLGVGHRNQLEIVGYRSAKAACLFVASRQMRSSGGGCGGIDYAPPEEHALVITNADGTPLGGGGRLSQIEGQLSAAVVAVRLRYRVHGRLRHSRAVVARVRGDVQERLGTAHPFGHFVATFHGCSSKAVVTALGTDGKVLESTTIAGDVLHLHVPCKGDAGVSGAFATESRGGWSPDRHDGVAGSTRNDDPDDQ